MVALRDYQQEAVDAVRGAFRAGRKRPLLVLPTGGGKTVCFSHITEGAMAKGRRVLILVHRQELLAQCSRSLSEMGVSHGIIAAGRTPDPTHLVQVASIQTLVRRLDRVREPDLIILDECHHAVAGCWAKVLSRWPQARVLGVTATPIRLDGKGLGSVFDELIEGPSVGDLIQRGYLAKPLYYAPALLDTAGIRTVAGDYDKKEVSRRMDRPTITGDAVEHYLRICPFAPAIAFCSSVAHAEHVAEAFRAAGVRAAVLDGSLSDFDRADRIRGLADGRYHVLTSCDLISEGTDIPCVTAAILLRPTKSLGLHLQQIGRVLRMFAGKANAIIIDHVGNIRHADGTWNHGLAEMPREWTLEGITRRKRGQPVEAGPKYSQCGKCWAVFPIGPACPQCGTARIIKERAPDRVDGVLEQLKVDAAAIETMRAQRREQGQARTLGDLIALGRKLGKKNPAGWAWHVHEGRKAKQQAP